MPGKFAATSANVNRIAANKFLFAGIFKILPSRHPADGGVGNVVRSRRLANQARDEAIAGVAVEVIAKILAERAAGIGDAGGPVTGLGIEHDVRGFDARRGEHDNLSEYFDFTLVVAIDISDSRGLAALVDQNRADQRVGQQCEVFGVLRFRNGEPGRREERSGIAAAGAVATIVASGMTVVSDSELRAAIGQIGHANFFAGFLNDVVKTAPGNLWEVIAVGIAGAILNGAGHAHVAFGFRKPWSDFRVIDWPIFAEAIEAGGFEVDIAVARRRAAPKVGFAAGAFAALPIPVGAGSIAVGDVVLEKLGPFGVLAFFDGIVFLMRAAGQTQRIALAAVFQIVRLAMHAVVLGGIGAWAGIEREDAKAGFAEKFHGHAAASTCANHDRVEKSHAGLLYPAILNIAAE